MDQNIEISKSHALTFLRCGLTRVSYLNMSKNKKDKKWRVSCILQQHQSLVEKMTFLNKVHYQLPHIVNGVASFYRRTFQLDIFAIILVSKLWNPLSVNIHFTRTVYLWMILLCNMRVCTCVDQTYPISPTRYSLVGSREVCLSLTCKQTQSRSGSTPHS